MALSDLSQTKQTRKDENEQRTERDDIRSEHDR
jgi:hypothetical protein